ncbi:MAG: glycine--tRNA ligase subunit beta [Pseudomonadota bacterium]
MIETKNLLIELGTEELPPTALANLSKHFTAGIVSQLDKLQLNYAEVESFASPRRLAVVIKQLASKQQDIIHNRKGPSIKAAFDAEGEPTKAALGFAKSCQTTIDQLSREKTDKGEWLSFNVKQLGKETSVLLSDIIQTSLDKLPIPKRMHWGDLDCLFVRPVHWLVVLFGEDIVECNLMSVSSSNKSYGHRFHHPQEILIDDALNYENILSTQAWVIASFSKRKEIIRKQVIDIAQKNNSIAVIDEDLLDEVTGMVEWPVALSGSFDQSFLDVPAEALISAMKKHQKYFHVLDSNNNLLPVFITVANIDSKNKDLIKQGNERVIRPRLSDANFFWNNDLAKPLDDYLEPLKKVIFQNKLGSLFDKTQRVISLSEYLASSLSVDITISKRAAQLSKTDLLTDMISEFPDLQGIMGRYYATHQGEHNDVAIALDEQYLPRYSGDNISTNSYAQILSIADRIDSLFGIFAIGLIPTGDKDPFALRRASLGILRTIVENKLDIDLSKLIDQAANNYPVSISKLADKNLLLKFIDDRFKGYLRDRGVSYDVFDSVAVLNISQPYDQFLRIQAVKHFASLPEAKSLAAANKRISNILKKNKLQSDISINSSLFVEESEKTLFSAISSIQDQLDGFIKDKDYTQYLVVSSSLHETIDLFFDNVMVLCDDIKLKNNRIALVKSVHNLFIQIADLSLLQ